MPRSRPESPLGGGLVSSAHTEADIEWRMEAWRNWLRALRDDGELPARTGTKIAAAA